MPVALTNEFSGKPSKAAQWNAFLKKNRLEGETLETVTARLAAFLSPILFPGNADTFWTTATGWTTATS